MSEIFLSYRRQDSQSATGRLADRLVVFFGAERVFRDHDSIVAGDDFAEAIARAIFASSVVLVVIGPGWLDARDADGQRRLDDPRDFVRLEIESAIAQDVPIVPVLVEGARMPGLDSVPASLQAFTRCQAMELSESRWRYDADRLIDALQRRFAIEALPVDRTGTEAVHAAPVSPWMQRATRIAVDLLDLATHPTRLILRRQTGHATDHIRAFLFLLTSLTAGNIALMMSFSLPAETPRGPLDNLLHALGMLLSGAVLGTLALTFLLIVLAIAWRLAGTRVQFRQLSVVMAYIASGTWMGLCLGAFFLGLGLQLVDGQAFGRIALQLWPSRDGGIGATAWRDRLAEVQGQIVSLMATDPLPAFTMAASVVWLATAAWLFVAWQSFSVSFGVSRWRVLLATAIWLGLLAGATRLMGAMLMKG